MKMIEDPARWETKDRRAKKAMKIKTSGKKRAKKAKAGISGPANEDFNIKETLE